jgi:hypothetical protein
MREWAGKENYTNNWSRNLCASVRKFEDRMQEHASHQKKKKEPASQTGATGT